MVRDSLPPRGDLYNRHCPTRQVPDHVTGRWGGLILGAPRSGTLRFAALRRELDGVSENMLAQTLCDLERDGLVERRNSPAVPPHVEDSLTPLGRACAEHVWGLADWIEAHLRPLVAAQMAYDSRKTKG